MYPSFISRALPVTGVLVRCGRQAIVASALLAAAVTAPAQTAPLTLDRIKSDGVVNIGVRHSAAPFSYFDAAGQPQGFTWEVCKQIIKGLEAELGRRLTTNVVSVDLAQSFDKLADRSIDLQCGSTTHTAEREARVQFSKTFFVAGIKVAYRKADADFASPLKHGKVIALQNSTASSVVKKIFVGNTDKTLFAGAADVKSYEDGVALLKNKQADTFFADIVLLPLDEAITFRDKPLTVEPYALMMRKGDATWSGTVDRLLAAVLKTQGDALAKKTGLKGKINTLTREVWKRPSSDTALSLY